MTPAEQREHDEMVELLAELLDDGRLNEWLLEVCQEAALPESRIAPIDCVPVARQILADQLTFSDRREAAKLFRLAIGLLHEAPPVPRETAGKAVRMIRIGADLVGVSLHD